MLLTFLEAKRPLTKIFSDSGTTPYPLVKNVTSHEVDVTNTAEMHTAIVEHGNLNHGLLKGPLTKSLTNESRAGHADKIAPSQLFVLDIDGIESDVIGELPLVINEAALRRVSDKIIAQLPPAFHDVSYVTGYERQPSLAPLLFYAAIGGTPRLPKRHTADTELRRRLF